MKGRKEERNDDSDDDDDDQEEEEEELVKRPRNRPTNSLKKIILSPMGFVFVLYGYIYILTNKLISLASLYNLH